MAGKGLLVWLTGGVGVFLLYSAVGNHTPLSLIQSYLGSGSPQPFATASASGSGPTFGNGLTTKNASPFLPQLPNQPGTPLKNGQTYDTGPNGNYVPGSEYQLGSYGGSGVYDLIDANGNNLGSIPSVYQSNPNAYIPPTGGTVSSYA